MATRKKAAGPTPVEATEHTEASRLNIPTAELESFARDDESEPKKLLYPRDPSLDPQLVWTGKDEQDSRPLEVPAVPIYIQETIEPRSLIEDLRAHGKAGQDGEHQISFFDSYEGLEFGEKVDFYQHAGKWSNRMILGDSFLVMASLAEKEGLKGRVQMIFIDPPYGVDFSSNWQVSTRKRVVKDGKAEDATRQPEQIRAFRDTWKLGVHSYLAYMRDRLVLARDLLTTSGSVFVQIADENVHLIRSLLDEVFGAENAHPPIIFRKKMMPLMREPGFESTFDYLLWYQNNRKESVSSLHPLFADKETDGDSAWNWVEVPSGRRWKLSDPEAPVPMPTDARLFQPISMQPREYRENQDFVFEFGGEKFPPPAGVCWSTTRQGMERLADARRLHKSGERSLRYVYFRDDYPVTRLTAAWMDTAPATDMAFVVETSPKVIERLMLSCTNPGDLVLDPTCGGGTTATVAEKWGRRWITVDTSRVALALARRRLMSARFTYFLLADSRAGAAKEAELSGVPPAAPARIFDGDLRKGFVYKRVPHVTLGSIANNPDIQSGMDNDAIAAAIARHAETEVLYDRPYGDPSVVRVSGPFTVESLSPHRVLLEGAEAATLPPTAGTEDAARFVDHILDNLRKSGVQNTVRGERLEFESLESWPGSYVQARGIYQENGRERAAAICIGPEYGTVDTKLIREAAKEAARSGADTLVVCGFAFDPHAADEAGQFGRLTVLNTKMNPDLQIPDLLKKTGAGNLFMVFGEPDIDVRPADDDRIQVEIRGVDVYDPTTGQVRSHSTDDIACWFIDTDYNGESFFVRHAYFSGGDDPYDKLRRALKADIAEEAWASLYSTTSRPFPKPDTGKIAVKVINHYGDEVMKVYEA
jgi:adenine-specific DNA-methyltransferase